MQEFKASEKASEYEQDLLLQYQTEFVSEANAKRTKKKRARNKKQKCPFAVTGQRQSAFIHLKALDNLLQLTIGSGLDAFIAGDNLEDVIAYIADSSKEGSIPATLTLHLDEGSPAYAMVWFLVNHCGLRIIHIRDIFHREWNDVKLAVGQCSLWDVVVLTTAPMLPAEPLDAPAELPWCSC